MPKKKRYVQDGTIIKEIFDSPLNNIDSAWYTYPRQVLEKHKGKVDNYGVNQISKHDPRAKKYMKDNNIHVPSSEPDIVDQPPEYPAMEPLKIKSGPGKYRSQLPPTDGPSLGELAELRRKNEEGTR